MFSPRRRIHAIVVLVVVALLVVESLPALPVSGQRAAAPNLVRPFRAVASAFASVPEAFAVAAGAVGDFFGGLFGGSSAQAAKPQPSPSPSPTQTPEPVEELIELRTRDSKTIKNADGTYTAQFGDTFITGADAIFMMGIIRGLPNYFFPFSVSGPILRTGSILHLSNLFGVLPIGRVRVEAINLNGFLFRTLPDVISVNPIDDFTWAAAALSKDGVCYVIALILEPPDGEFGAIRYGRIDDGGPCLGRNASPATARQPDWPESQRS